jgi:hypothetical protein
MHSRKLAALAAALGLVALPAGLARADSDHGKGHGRDHAPGLQHQNQNATSHSHAVAWIARGTVKSVDTSAKTLTITVFDRKGATNHHARSWRGQDVTFDVSKTHLNVHDVNGDGKRDWSDVAVNDIARVLAKLPRASSTSAKAADSTPIPAKRVTVKHPGSHPDNSDSDSGEHS